MSSAKEIVQQRATVAKLSREDLEDKYFKTLDDINVLKIHGRKQEQKIKKMATKLIRLTNDRKALLAQASSVPRSSREVDLEETIEKHQETIQRLHQEKEDMKKKLYSCNQQVMLLGKHPYHFDVHSHFNSAKPRHGTARFDKTFSERKRASPQLPKYGHSLLEEARKENENLKQEILVLHEQVAKVEEENESLKLKIETLIATHEEEILQMRQHESNKEKSILDENIELIRLQRQFKQKSVELSTLQSKYRDVHENYVQLRNSYDKVLVESEKLKSQLLEEENRNLSIMNSLKHDNAQKSSIALKDQTIHELEKEVVILKEANEKLISSTFNQEKEQQWLILEKELRIQIAQLEAAIKADMHDKNNILDKISNQRGFTERLHSENVKTSDHLARVQRENEELRNQLKIFSLSDDSFDVDEVKEALLLIRRNRHSTAHQIRPDFLENVETEDTEMEYSSLQQQHAETIQELDKTREMLLMQHKINKDYQIEVESVTNQMHEIKQDYEKKLDHFARLLDARNARIKKLENQLHDVAYGTKQYKVDISQLEVDTNKILDNSLRLERGENLVEINISKVIVSNEGLAILDDHEASLFVTYAFYDYELVSTPILKLPRLLFDFTTQYVVKVDDVFLHHLQKDGTTFELHQALGVEYKTIGSCKIRFNQLISNPQGKLHGSATLIGINGSNMGVLDYWIRLYVPMEQAIRLYRERVKALGYLSANSSVTKKNLNELDADLFTNININQLLIHVISCNHVQGRQKDVQPNIYCVYKFFDFVDHDTVIIPSTNNPTFDDRQIYPLIMNDELDAYLRSEKLHIYIFDDSDPDMASYLGKAVIDLLPLAHNKAICAPFELQMSDGKVNGSVEVAARWQQNYIPPSTSVTNDTYFEDNFKENEPLTKKPPVPSNLSSIHNSSTPKPTKKKSIPFETYSEEIKMMNDDQNTYEQLLSIDNKSTNLIVPSKLEEGNEEKKEFDLPQIEIKYEAQSGQVKKSAEEEIIDSELNTFISDVDQVEPKIRSDYSLPKDNEIEEMSTILSRKSSKISIEKGKNVKVLMSSSDQEVFNEEENIVSDDSNDHDAEIPDQIEVIDASAKETEVVKEIIDYVKENDVQEDEISHQSDVEETIVQEADSIVDEADAIVEEVDAIIDKTEYSNEINIQEDEIPQQIDVKDDIIEEVSLSDRKTNSLEDISEQIVIKDDIIEEDTSLSAEKKTSKEEVSDAIQVCVNHLLLDPDTSVWDDHNVEKMFVEFDFLGSVEETPDAVMKPKNKNEKLVYNFKKSIDVSKSSNNDDKYDLLSSMIMSQHTTFKLTVVSEPVADDDSQDCEEIGSAIVDLATILENNRDFKDDDVIVNDLRHPGSIVGWLNISVEALNVLKKIKEELMSRLPIHEI